MSGRSEFNPSAGGSITAVAERYSVAMTAQLEKGLLDHLIRHDGQEDLCLAVYQPSTGASRLSALLEEVVLPREGETEVHGTVSFTGEYVLRAAAKAQEAGGGVVILHSHPGGRGWQGMSGPDNDAEAAYANLVREMTGLPLVGMTVGGADTTWSARFWSRGLGTDVAAAHCESVRVVGEQLRVSWNPRLRPAPALHPMLTRTASCWGPSVQADLARLRILVVGAGTLGLDVALRLAASGVQQVGLLDYDSLKIVNLDRMIGARPLDTLLYRSKVEVAKRLLQQNATAERFRVDEIEGSICEPGQLARALDYDLIFCCIDDHPWPRSVLNTIAYSDLVPVIDGGIHVDAFPDDGGMRNATWRSHVLRPGRPCMICNRQLEAGKIVADKEGLLNDAEYIEGLPPAERPQNQNVAMLAVSAVGSLLAQFVSFVAAPAGVGEPGPLRYTLSAHWLERVEETTREHCSVEGHCGVGDRRTVLVADDLTAREEVSRRQRRSARPLIRLLRAVDDALAGLRARVDGAVARAKCPSSGA